MNPTLVLFVGGGLGLLLLVVGAAISLLGSRSVVEERLGRYAETGGMVAGPSTEVSEERKKDSTSPLSEFLNRMGEGLDPVRSRR